MNCPLSEPVREAMRAIFSITYPAQELECLVGVPGMGEDRESEPIALWQQINRPDLPLIFAGYNHRETCMPPGGFTTEWLRENRGLGDREPVRLGHQENTRDQMQAIADVIGDRITGLMVTPYHLPRAYMTLLACCFKNNVTPWVVPIPLSVDLDSISPEQSKRAGRDMRIRDLFQQEGERIEKYQPNGDICSFRFLAHYLERLPLR
jgi:hypothetical protein